MERELVTGRWVEHVPSKKDHEWMKHGVLCMGNCPFCKDMKRDQMRRTKKEKEFYFEKMTSIN